MKIAFLGLGSMGAGIAARLLRAGHELVVWNRSAQKADALVNSGAQRAATPREAAAGREAVLTMLADDAALDEVLGGEHGLYAGLAGGTLHISMSTIAVAHAELLQAKHAARGLHYLAAPVFGRPEVAREGKLFVIVAGANAALKRAEPLLAALGQRTFHVGESAPLANVVKLCGNFMILAAIEAMAEAMTLAQKNGVAKAQLLEILTSTLFTAPLYKNYGTALVEDRVRPAGFAAPLGLKDMRLAGEAAEHSRVAMPLLSLLKDHLLETLAKEGEDVDWSAIGRTVARHAQREA